MNSPEAPGAADPSPGALGVSPRRIGRWLLALGLLALLGLLSSMLLWQKLSHIQEQLAKQSAEAGAQALDARTLARQAQELSRDAAARVALFEARLNEIALQRTQLQELMQSLSRSRDENLVVDIESAIRLAQQQAQLTGSVEPLLAALKSADQRVLRAAQPRLSPLQRAIVRDIDRIKAAVVSDTPSLLVKLDELVRLADELVLANAVVPAVAIAAAKQAQIAAPLSWWERSIQTVLDELRGLLRVSRIEAPEAALLSPEQSFFLRENFKLKLLNARLGLLARQMESARADLVSARSALEKYFETGSRKTQIASALLLQVHQQMQQMQLPRVDDTLAALATAAAGR
jgi:uroporphyrin-3 C-methyltransferase